jgi:ribosomal protein S18 acetylase RimI-like enzyme
MDSPKVTIATATDRESVVTTTVEAFRPDPAFNYFFPDDFDRQAAVLAGSLFDQRVDTASTWIAEGGAALAMWDRPRATGAPGPDDGENGSIDLLSSGAIERLQRYDAAVDARLPPEPHWYLGVLATHPDHAGKRWARGLLRHGLLEAGRAGVPAALETTNPGNVTRYQAGGWVVRAEVDVDDLHVWILGRDGIPDEN